MKISELMGHLDLVWQEYGDVDVWFYDLAQKYYSGGGPGLSDTGGGWSTESEMFRITSAFAGTDDYNKDNVRAFVGRQSVASIKKRNRENRLSQRDTVHIKE